jgi:hypothetical protein
MTSKEEKHEDRSRREREALKAIDQVTPLPDGYPFYEEVMHEAEMAIGAGGGGREEETDIQKIRLRNWFKFPIVRCG